MNPDNQVTNKTEMWRQFCIDVLSCQSDDLQTLNIESRYYDEFIQFLYMHGLENLLIDLLEQQNSVELLANYIVEKLIDIRRASHIKEIYRQKHLQNLLHLLTENQINCLILKGTAFAYSLYRHPYQRSRVDTDILIKSDDKEKAKRLLNESGFDRPLNISGELISHQTTYSQTKDGIKYAYDLHWKISNSNVYAECFKFDQLYANKVKIAELSNYAYRLSDIDAFLHAAVHYFGHFSNERDRLIWIYDLHLLCLRFSNHDWEVLLKQSYDSKLDPLCHPILKLCKKTFDTSLPPHILEQFAQSKAQLSKIEHKRIYGSSWSRIDQFKSDWAALGVRQRCLLVKEYLFPPTDFVLEQNQSSNKFLLPYFYVKRIIQGGLKLINKKSN